MLKGAVSSVMSEKVILIITDDNSNDGTKEWCEALCAKNSNVVYTQNKKYKRGPNGNKNNGLDCVKTEYFTFLDDDDFYLDGAVLKMLEKIKEGYAAVFANCVKSDGSGIAGVALGNSGNFTNGQYLCGKLEGEFAVIFRSDAVGGLRFDEEQYGAEIVLWGKALRSKKMYYMDFDAKVYRVGHTSVMTTLFDNASKGLICYKNLIAEFESELLGECPKMLFRYYSLLFLYASLAGDKDSRSMAVKSLFRLKSYSSLKALKTIVAAFLPLFVVKKAYGFRF